MDKYYLVLWRGANEIRWAVDGIYTDPVHAKAKLTLEELDHPRWEHMMLEIDLPAKVKEAVTA